MNIIGYIKQSKKLTIKEISNITGISYSFAAKISSGEKKISINVLKKIKKAFPDIDVDIFLN